MANRILITILRRFLMRGLFRGMGRMGGAGGSGRPADPAQRQQEQTSRNTTRQASRMLRIGRRFGRF